jgi:hypothetical protein
LALDPPPAPIGPPAPSNPDELELIFAENNSAPSEPDGPETLPPIDGPDSVRSMGGTAIGSASPEQAIEVTNEVTSPKYLPATVTAVRATDPRFTVNPGDDCVGQRAERGPMTCIVVVVFRPVEVGAATSTIEVDMAYNCVDPVVPACASAGATSTVEPGAERVVTWTALLTTEAGDLLKLEAEGIP